MKRREEIELVTKSISINDVEDIDDNGQFAVRSQTTPTHAYHVDIEAYTCDCDSYPLISYCKHIAAVQLHYYEDINIQPVQSLFTQTSNSSIHEPGDTAHVRAAPNLDDTILASIPEKLQQLVVRMRLSPPHILSNSLRQLDNLLDQVLAECMQPQVLPKQTKVPPNQHSWPETVKVMGAAVKTKRKSMHTDPYSGGEKSGKKAKTDARAPLAVRSQPRCVHLTLQVHNNLFTFLSVFQSL